MDFTKYRELFPVTRNWTYLITGATAPLAKPVYQACADYLEENSEQGFRYYSQIGEIIEKPKTLFSRIVNCDVSELAFVPNSTHGINLVSQMVRPKKGENVVICDLEYYGCAYPWLRTQLDGVEVRVAKSEKGRLPVENVEKLVDDNTRVVSIAQVCHSGFRQDLKSLSKLAHDHGAYMVSDAIGACGVVEVDVKQNQVDFLTTSSYKWLLGLQGGGFLYVRKGLVEQFDPPFPGSQATPSSNWAKLMLSPTWDKVNFPKSATRYETGMPSIIAATSLVASLKLLLKIGMQNVAQRVSDLTQCVIDNMEKIGLEVITPVERNLRGGHVIVFMKNKKQASDVCASLFKKKIHVQSFVPFYGPKNGGLFIAPDFFNTEAEIESLAKRLAELVYD
ncbi:MAG: aminotransferase class V-fold PLP-dependent enzyme [Nitrososphaerales archaeon]